MTGMHQTEQTLTSVSEIIERDPHSATALILYALLTTLAFEKSGCLFKLDKLRDLDQEHRQLAYQLIEVMARKENRSAVFDNVRQHLAEVVRNA